MRRKAAAVVLAVSATVAGAACAGGGGGDDERADRRNDGTVKVGDQSLLGGTDSEAPATTAETGTVSSPPPQLGADATPAEESTSTPPGPVAPERGHRTVVDVDGFRLYLTVGDSGQLEFGRDDLVRLTVRIENRSGERREYDTNEKKNFEILRADDGSVAWDDVRCAKGQSPRDPLITGTVALESGRSVSFSDAYPDAAARNESDPLPRPDCRVEAGEYDVVGIFNWCPPGSAPNGTCYPDRLARARSAPVRIRFY